MTYLVAMWSGLLALLHPDAILLLMAGMLAGTFVGVIPGLGGAVLLTMLLPFLYGMDVVQGLALMVAAHASIYFAGSITAILLNTPGAPKSAPTTIDGYQMTRQGKAARALGISAAATTLGGWIGFFALLAVIPFMFTLISVLKPPEYLLLAILAVVLVGQLHSGETTKGLLSGAFGFLMSFIGYDPITGIQRFSFNLLSLYNGFSIVVVALGLFAMSEMYYLYGRRTALAEGVSLALSQQPGARVVDGLRDVFEHRWLVLRSAAIGVFVGLVPGVGGVAGNFISYGQAMRTSRHPERFGTGTPEGIIAPESSSLAKEAASFIPTLALGIPSTVGTAVMLGALQILGVPPGPTMLTTHLSLVFTIAWALAITSLLASVIGLVLAPWLARVTLLPGPVLVPFVFAMAMLGAYAGTTDFIEVVAVVAFGVVGLLMKKLSYSLPGAIIGFILGDVLQNNLYLTERLGGWRFVTQPLADFLLLVIVVVLFIPLWQKWKKGAKVSSQSAAAPTEHAAERRIPDARLDLAIDGLWVVMTAVYVVTARTYPSDAGLVPTVIGVFTLFVALVQLALHLKNFLSRSTNSQAESDAPSSGPEKGAERSYVTGREMIAVLWAAALALAIYLVGYAFAIPLFMVAYFTLGYRVNWIMTAISATAMWALTYPVIERGFSVHLPGGLLFKLFS